MPQVPGSLRSPAMSLPNSASACAENGNTNATSTTKNLILIPPPLIPVLVTGQLQLRQPPQYYTEPDIFIGNLAHIGFTDEFAAE
jgi:hypothetical protein